MDFSNREISSYIWIALIIGVATLKRDVRVEFSNVLRAFFQRFILAMLAIAGAYIAILIIAFAHFDIWTRANLKTTILWAISFAFSTMFDINRVSEDHTFFTKAVREAFAITGILILIVESYSFSLPFELFAVPLLILISLLHAVANEPKHAQVKRLTKGMLSAIGVLYLGYSVYRIVLDPRTFITLNQAREFGLPILLTLCFLPFLYALVVYAGYERSFIGLAWAIPDPRLRKRAKWRAILAFGVNLDLLRHWVRSIHRFNPSNIDELRRSFDEIKIMRQREATPPVVASESGWSPYLAKDFLKENGLPTGHYQRLDEDEWFANSNYLEIGESLCLKNNIAYYISGNEHAATKLKLVLNVNVPDAQDEAERRFNEMALALLHAATGHAPDAATRDGIHTNSFTAQVGGSQIELKKDVWQGGIPGGYSRALTIHTLSDT